MTRHHETEIKLNDEVTLTRRVLQCVAVCCSVLFHGVSLFSETDFRPVCLALPPPCFIQGVLIGSAHIQLSLGFLGLWYLRKSQLRKNALLSIKVQPPDSGRVCCSEMQCDAVCCSVLQCVAVADVCCGMFANPNSATTPNPLFRCSHPTQVGCVTVCCSVLQCVAVADVCCGMFANPNSATTPNPLFRCSHPTQVGCVAVCCSVLQWLRCAVLFLQIPTPQKCHILINAIFSMKVQPPACGRVPLLDSHACPRALHHSVSSFHSVSVSLCLIISFYLDITVCRHFILSSTSQCLVISFCLCITVSRHFILWNDETLWCRALGHAWLCITVSHPFILSRYHCVSSFQYVSSFHSISISLCLIMSFYLYTTVSSHFSMSPCHNLSSLHDVSFSYVSNVS